MIMYVNKLMFIVEYIGSILIRVKQGIEVMLLNVF